VHEAGLLRIALPRLFAVDWRFQERAKTGPGEDAAAALARFWARPELAPLGEGLDLPHESWEAVLAALERLSDPAAQPDRMQPWTPMPAPGEQPWAEAARLGAELAAEDPVAGTVAVLYAVAAWEGALGNDLYAQPWTGHHWGWHHFPAALGRALLAADAVWTAREVVERALGFVEAAKGFPLNEALAEVAAEYTALDDRVDRRLGSCIAELAWALRASLTDFRPEVAAILWTLGDARHAELVAGDAEYVPPLQLVRDLVEVSMSRIPTDPFLQYLWLELKDRPPLDLRGHKVLFAALNNVYHSTGVHEVEAMGLVSPSRAFARAAIAHFAGHVPAETREAFHEAGLLFGELVGTREPLALLRLWALRALADDGPAAAEEWSRLAGFATEILERSVRRGVFRPLHNCLDIPFHYLGADELDAVERYRCAGLAYWLAIAEPPRPAERAAASLVAEEDELLRELRGARFIRVLPHLPAHYRRYGFEIRDELDRPVPEGATELDEQGGLLRFDPFDQEHAARLLDETWDRLGSVWERMRDVAPEYAAERLEPFASAEELRRALAPPGRSGHV
jgi:hypothetical protein